MKSAIVACGALALLCGALTVTVGVSAQPECKGPNKNDPGCPGTEEPPPNSLAGDAISNVSVDWLNEAVVIRGSGLLAASEFRIGGSVPLIPSASSDTEVVLDFDATVAAEVIETGNYVLFADGVPVMNLYFEESVVDPAAVGCPCAGGWAAEPGVRWGAQDTSCLEVPGPGSKDYADIAGTVLDVSLDPAVYPQFAIGAAFVPGQPRDSVCSLVQIGGDASQSVLLKHRVNESQQSDCAAELQVNVCAP